MGKTEDIRRLLAYDPETGVITWRQKPNRNVLVGAKAGRLTERGYIRIGVGGTYIFGHQVAWVLTHGEWPAEIDHINGDGADNRIANLRLANRAINSRNRKAHRSADLVGVKFVAARPTNPYHAFIQIDGKKKYLGSFKTPEAAHAAYRKASDSALEKVLAERIRGKE